MKAGTKLGCTVTQIIDSSPVPMFVVDTDYTIQEANQEWAEAVEADSIADLYGMNALGFVNEEERDTSRNRLAKVLQESQKLDSREYTFQTLHGDARHARGSIVPITFENGNDGAHIILEDVTKTKETKQEVNTRREQIKALHEVGVEIAQCDNRDEIWNLMVEAGEQILNHDICLVDSVQDGQLRVEATSSGMPEEGYNEPTLEEAGIAGKVYQSGESLIHNPEADSEAEPQDEYREGITVSISKYGVFQAASYESDVYDQTDLELVELLASHVTAAFQRLDHEQELEERRQRVQDQREKIELLHDVGIQLAECNSNTTVYELLVEAGEDILGLNKCLADSVQNGKFVVEATSDKLSEDDYFEAPVDSTEAGLAGKAYRTGDSILEEEEELAEAAEKSEFKSSFTVPIGEYGVFQALSEETVAFDRTDVELVEILAEHAQTALHRLEQENALETRQQKLQQQRAQVTRVNQVGVQLAKCESAGEIYQQTVDAAEDILELDLCTFELIENGRLQLGAGSSGIDSEGYNEPSIDSEEAGLAGKAYREKTSFLVDDVDDYAEASPVQEYRSCLIIPLDDRGIFQAVSYEEGAFDETDFELVELLLGHTRESLRRLEHQEAIRERQNELDLLRQVLSRFLRHNIRNELTVLRGNVEMINTTAENESVLNAADILMDSLDRLQSHTEKAREIDELVNEERVIQTGSLRRIVSTAVANYKKQYPEASIQENVDDVDISAIIGVEKAISNAVENSLSHNSDSVDIEIRSEIHEDIVNVYIEDNGAGLPESEKEIIMEEEETPLSHGSGVGLWLMKWSVEKSGGELFLSNTDEGARVEMELPLAE